MSVPLFERLWPISAIPYASGCALLALIVLAMHRVRSTRPQVHYVDPGISVSATSTRQSHEKAVGSERSSTTKQVEDREPGTWTPVHFDYPPVEPVTEDFRKIKPIPYRPFRWGTYHVTMGIRNMPWDEWIEIDRHFLNYHRVVQYRILDRGERVIKINDAQPGIVESGYAASKEFVYEFVEYISRRYPSIYRVTREPIDSVSKKPSGWYGQGRIKTITILPLQVTYDLDAEDPMKVAALLTQEDFAIMVEGTDGRYYLQAGAICIAGAWRMMDKMGMPLDEIHTSGHVPQYKSKLQLSMNRFFRRLPVDKPVVRNNYSFQVVKPSTSDPSVIIDPTELAWAKTMQGDENSSEFARGDEIRYKGPTDETGRFDPTTMFLRTERQTLRRLPRTGAIAFTIRVYQTPVVELVKEPGVPGRLASAVRGWPEDVAQYKVLSAYEDVLQYLDERHAEQLEQGVVQEDNKTTQYPF